VDTSKIIASGVSAIILAGVIIMSFKLSDNELMARLSTIYEQPHIPNTSYPVPQYFNDATITSSTVSTTNSISNYITYEGGVEWMQT
jgi:hypothetical protein